jgi:hypothetical protein
VKPLISLQTRLVLMALMQISSQALALVFH